MDYNEDKTLILLSQEIDKIEHRANQRKYDEDKRNLAIAYNIRGSTYADLDKLDEAVNDYNYAIKLLTSIPKQTQDIKEYLADVYNNRGSSVRDLGKTKQALQDHNQAIRILDKIATHTPKIDIIFANAYINKAYANLDLQQPIEAIKDYDNAILIFESIDNRSNDVNDELARAYNNRANIKRDLGTPEHAIDDLERSIEIRETIPKEKRTLDINIGLAIAYNNLGNVKRHLQQPEEAVANLKKTFEIYNKIPPEKMTPKIKGVIASAYISRAFVNYYKLNIRHSLNEISKKVNESNKSFFNKIKYLKPIWQDEQKLYSYNFSEIKNDLSKAVEYYTQDNQLELKRDSIREIELFNSKVTGDLSSIKKLADKRAMNTNKTKSTIGAFGVIATSILAAGVAIITSSFLKAMIPAVPVFIVTTTVAAVGALTSILLTIRTDKLTKRGEDLSFTIKEISETQAKTQNLKYKINDIDVAAKRKRSQHNIDRINDKIDTLEKRTTDHFNKLSEKLDMFINSYTPESRLKFAQRERPKGIMSYESSSFKKSSMADKVTELRNNISNAIISG